ncbi:hypothetical protein OS175_12495 [Marinicella sp. S1101]|nr:hypothetical protein [Marinicella marina]MCX7554701.1 hypothetical protein [Marinicella marina]
MEKSNFNELKESPHKAFFLTQLNYVFLFGYIALAFILLFTFHEFSSYLLGRTLGKILGAAILSIIVGYLLWLFSMKNDRVGEWGFNLMVLYISFSLLTSYYKAYQINQAAEEMQQAVTDFDETIKNERLSFDDAGVAYERFSENLFSGISKQLENAEGIDKEVLLIEQDYLKEIMQVTDNWYINLEQFMVKDVLDPSMLKADPVVYENRLKIIQNTIDTSLEYKALMVQMEAEINQRLRPLDLPPKVHKQIVENFIYSPDYTLDQLVETVDGFISYLDQCRKVLNILNNNKDKWFMDGINFYSEDDDFIMNYDYAIESLWQKEIKSQELFAELYQ